MERTALLVGWTTWDAQLLALYNSGITARIQFHDVIDGYAIHAGDGSQCLTFLDGVHDVRLVFLCLYAQAHHQGKQQRT